MICGVSHPCHALHMPHVILIQWCASIYIQVSSSLDHYTTGDFHGSSSWIQQPISITAECVWGVVGDHVMVYGVIHPCQALHMSRITLIKM